MIAIVKQSWVAWHEGREGSARSAFRRAQQQTARFDTLDWQALGYLGIEMEEADVALAALTESLRLDDTLSETHLLLGVVQRRHERHAEAIRSFEQALKIRPSWPDAINNLAIALEDAGRYDEAIVWLTRGLKAHPKDMDLWNELGSCLCAAQRAEESLQAFRKACDIDPSFAPMRWNLATALLQAGRYEQGWELYDTRLDFLPEITAPETPRPLWTGEPLAGKTILVWHEQGLGDMIQFARYLPLLADSGAQIILRAPKSLKRLLQGIHGVKQVVEAQDKLPMHDYHLPVMSLARSFWPQAAHGFRADLFGPAITTKAVTEKTRIGLVYAGSPSHADDARRSLPVDVLRPLLALPGIEWVNLQQGAESPPDWPQAAQLTDFHDTAEVMRGLDRLITCDTACAHLAGSLGVPTLLLLPFAADWRWGERSLETPWYPSLTLIRQSTPGDWSTVIAEVMQRL